MKKTSHDLTERADERSYKKRYLVRKLQEEEAKEIIEQFFLEKENPDRVDPQGKKRHER